MDDSLDPEVVADLQLRAASMHDSSRTRTANYAWTPPVVVDRWRCRASNCSGIVTATEEAIHALDTFNRELVRRGEQRIDTNKIMFCENCRATGATIGAERNRKHVDAMAKLVAELKQIADEPVNEIGAARERTLIENCKLMHHPDVDGLVQALRERRERNGNAKSGKRRL